MKDLVLAFDQGTTSSRAIVFDKTGDIVGKGQYEFPQYYPSPGWVEHVPEEILKSQFYAVADALRMTGPDGQQRIAAVGITNQRETTLVWERETGRPIYNAIVWQCRRTAAICHQLQESGLAEYITQKTGLLIDAYFSATKIKWILDNVDGAQQKAERGELLFGTVDSWIIWNLTGGKIHATDYSNAARTMLFDIEDLCWDARLCHALNIPMCMLPEVKPSSGIFGIIAPKVPGFESLSGIPITGVAGDQQAALFGQTCFEPGQAKNTYGTGCFLMMNTGRKSLRCKNGLLTTIAWGLHPGEVCYALEGSVFNAGSVIKWLRDELQMIRDHDEINHLAVSVKDTGGVYMVPAFTGLGAPYWDMYARGIIVGLNRGTTKAHIARAVLESISYQTADLIFAMQKDCGYPIRELKVDGGASASDVLMQIQANMLQVDINRPRNVETTALGAAYLAGLAAGVWNSPRGIIDNWQSERVFSPQMDIQTRDDYYSGWKRAVERSMHWEPEV